ncbi:MAG: host attachment protein [Devosia sp.]|nr:host attachment protein [Devosia sp.]
MKAKVTWVLVADGGQAKVFENLGPGKGLRAITDLKFEDEHLQARELVSDRPGRSFSSVGHGRSAMEPSSDPVAVRERRFVEHLAIVLAGKLAEGAFDRLIVAAAPTALGDLRPALSKPLREVIVLELPKDLTKLTTPDLEASLSQHLAI